MRAEFTDYTLRFIQPGGTSRGVLREKLSYFILLRDKDRFGIGECGILKGLSADDRPGYEAKLRDTLNLVEQEHEIHQIIEGLSEWPSIQFGLEMAWKSFNSVNPFVLFDNVFSRGEKGIPINGLIWMGSFDEMATRVEAKLLEGFSCLKFKIGAIGIQQELQLLKEVRKRFDKEQLEIRVDANGAFKYDEAVAILDSLSDLAVHSIEQPLKKGNWQEMAALCEQTPVPIALDEDLIGVYDKDRRNQMLETIKPQYIILKPSFVGGFEQTKIWIDLANTHGASYWLTSALESNVGLNAIAQFTQELQPSIPQGLGTGQLYSNNFPSPLDISDAKLVYTKSTWDLNLLGYDQP